MKYQFESYDKKSGTLEDGYTIIQIVNGAAIIDQNDPDQVALAKRFGGVPVAEKKTKGKK